MESVTSFGAWVQQHRKALHLTQAALAQQVGCAVVTIKKIEQELRRPSPEMAELLADQLAVAATDRPQFLAMARGQMLDAAPNGSTITLPPFLQNPQQRPPPRFVARSAEMDHLHRQLRQALTGKVQIAFIRGEAGRGKTSLLQAFAQQAQHDVPDLIVAEGACSAHVGQGDPFLPVRDLFDMLTGDIETHWQAGSLSLDQARRLWRFVPAVTQTLLDEGVDLFGILVSPGALYTRLKAHSAAQFTGLDRLRQMSQQPFAPRLDQTQAQLFEQITRVLAALSGAKPLLLLLDDLQWIDETSLALLFHLSRRLVAQRIMIVATYRGSEVTDAHPLQTTVTELTRRFGDIVLDLEENDAWHNRLFFEALVEAEAPRLTDDFKDQLFAVTEGHPLFTVELLRYLQNEHYLVRDEEGAWLHEKQIRFDSLPSRVDAVISQRISRLDPKLQEILRVAAVEGERFTAQVVAQTLDIDERSLLRHLTHLAQQHKLVREYSHERIEQHYLNRYQFQHTLFPQYLYGSLGDGERRLLHHTVAQHIEGLAGHQADRFAMTLAYHYGEADDAAKTATYHAIAGDQSRQASALPEAVRHYGMALAVWSADDPAGRADLLCKQADCMRTLGKQVDGLTLLKEALILFTELGNTLQAGDTLRRIGRLYWELGEGNTGKGYYEQALALLETYPDSVEFAEAISAIGRMHMLASDNAQAVNWCRRATALAERLGAEPVVIHANNTLGPALVGLNQVDQGLALLRQNIECARTLKLHYEVCCGYINLDGMLKLVGQNDARSELLEAFLDYAREVHAVHYVSCALIQLSEAAWFTGYWRTALHHHQEIAVWDREYPLAPVIKIWFDTLSGMIYNDLNQPQQAYDILMEELERARNIDEMLITLPLLGQMARAMAALGRSAETLGLVREMVALFERTPAAEGTELLLIVHHWLIEQTDAEAQALAATIRSYLEHFDRTMELPLTGTIWREAQGTAALQAHDIDKAILCFQQAAAGWASLERPYNQLRTLNFLSQAWQEAGDVDQAQAIFAQLLAIGETLAEQIDDSAFRASFLKSLPKR